MIASHPPYPTTPCFLQHNTASFYPRDAHNPIGCQHFNLPHNLPHILAMMSHPPADTKMVLRRLLMTLVASMAFGWARAGSNCSKLALSDLEGSFMAVEHGPMCQAWQPENETCTIACKSETGRRDAVTLTCVDGAWEGLRPMDCMETNPLIANPLITTQAGDLHLKVAHGNNMYVCRLQIGGLIIHPPAPESMVTDPPRTTPTCLPCWPCHLT